MARAQAIDPARILASGDGLGWDVQVPNQPARYDAATIVSMVKLVNRRGLVRFFERDEEEEVFWTRKRRDQIRGVDELEVFVSDTLDCGAELVISFEDRNEARTFARDLASLQTSKPELRAQVSIETRQRLKVRYTPERYPSNVEVAQGEFNRLKGVGWVALINARAHDGQQIDWWMRRHIEARYWPAVWEPGGSPRFGRSPSWRYWHLRPERWDELLSQCDGETLLIINFYLKADLERFDAVYGPQQFVAAF